MLEQLSSKSSGGKKKNLLNVRALLFYEKECIISSRVSGRLLNDPASANVFQANHTSQQSLQQLGADTQDSQQSGTVLISPLLLILVAVFWVKIAKLFLVFYFQVSMEHTSVSFFQLKSP